MAGRREDAVWRDERMARAFLRGVRAGIPYAGIQIDVMVRLAEALGREVRKFVDIGCGDGPLSEALLERWPSAKGTLVDFNALMLKEAGKRLKQRGSGHRFIRADLAERGWTRRIKERAPFDVCVSGFAIHHQADPAKRRIYRDVLSLLRPGGLFVNIDHVASRSAWGKGAADALFADSLGRSAPKAGLDDDTREAVEDLLSRPGRDSTPLSPVETQCEWMREIGFTDVDCFFKAFDLALFAGRRLEKRTGQER